ncbi:MAG: ATP-binding protein [Proteobacteria bacterium]|nr:ATP-binding protein [Pseudomonadota bacterium]
MNTGKKIPYGISSYKTIRQKNCYYVDKTRYIPEFENTGEFLFLIRPRRFGKSSLLTVLECYYDIARKDEFDFLFDGTFISKYPTPEKNTHLILKFNFSQVSPDPGKVEESFNEHADTCFFFFGEKYREFLDDKYFKMMERKKSAHGKLEFLLQYIGSKNIKVCVLIDEYDNFTNTVLTTAGQEKYHELTHGAGFFRFFFNVLKGATDQVDSGISRMFITGVSPVTMDDVTSGFNIGRNISLNPLFNELLGFTHQDVAEIIKYYQNNSMAFTDADEILNLMKEWYGHYCFSAKSVNEMFNPDMVLYFIKNFLELGEYPDNLIDQNVRIDYGKLRHLLVLDRRLNGNFSYLNDIMETILADIAESFPVERLTRPSNFISLLFYFGLLSYTRTGELHIPNRTVRKLMYSYLREGYEDVDVFNVDMWCLAGLIRNMAYKGEWKPVFQFLACEVEKQTSVRDYLTGEKVIQTFLLAYLNVTDYFITRSEEEMGKGFADLYLEPFLSKYPDVKYCYLVELKYIKRGEFSDEELKKQLSEAREQLMKYAADESVVKRSRGTTLKCLVLVFSGWELKAAEEYDFSVIKAETCKKASA